MRDATDQELFWRGEFGNDYIERNKSNMAVASNVAFFSRIVGRMRDVGSIIEFGANIGMNLMALKTLLPEASVAAVEINEKAASILPVNVPGVEVLQQSIYDCTADSAWDMALVKGVLIHLNPEMLPRAYEVIHEASARYIVIAEYYNPRPVEVDYRGHSGKLFKRDFAGEMLDAYQDLALVDYGFTYHRDPHFPQDDLNWFLLEKRN